MNRNELDALASHYRLSLRATDEMLDIAGAKTSAAERSHFLIQALRLAGVLSLAAGIIFFIAANWQALHVFGRFALLQVLLLLALGAAIWRVPPHSWGRYSLLLAFALTGALFALFGQTYQTGADVHELFLTWALLSLPFVIAAQWSVVSAAWILVLNLALALYCGARPEGGLLSQMFSGWSLNRAQLLLAPVLVNLALSIASGALGSAYSTLTSRWVTRLLIACAIGFATWAGTLAITGWDLDWGTADRPDPRTLSMIAAVLLGIAIHVLRRREDVFPVAMLAGSVIIMVTFAIAQHSGSRQLGLFFMIALWLIVSSTLCGRGLMHLLHAWRGEQART